MTESGDAVDGDGGHPSSTGSFHGIRRDIVLNRSAGECRSSV